MSSNLNWPADFPRTDATDRTRNNSYDVTLSRAFDDLEAELDRLGVDDFDYDFDAQQRKTDQRPYSRASPDDPSFVVRWSMDGETYAVACDRYSRLRDNVRTAGLYIREKRKMESRPVATGESEYANLRLPAGDEPIAPERTPRTVLGVGPDADAQEIRSAYRERVKQVHPDLPGGDEEEFKRVEKAKDALLS